MEEYKISTHWQCNSVRHTGIHHPKTSAKSSQVVEEKTVTRTINRGVNHKAPPALDPGPKNVTTIFDMVLEKTGVGVGGLECDMICPTFFKTFQK